MDQQIFLSDNILKPCDGQTKQIFVVGPLFVSTLFNLDKRLKSV